MSRSNQAFDEFSSLTIEQRRQLYKSTGSSLKWVELPVDLKTFIECEPYLHHNPLSSIQFEAVYESSELFDIEAAYRNPTQVAFRQDQYTKIVVCWGKGAGKNTVGRIIISRILYLLGCLFDPHKVLGREPHDSIDILNMALGEDQAMDVFFAPWKRMIRNSEWFMNKLQVRIMASSIRVPPIIKSDEDSGDMYAINAWCGNSSQEGAEGRNLLACVLDEIDAFADLKYRSGGNKKTSVGTAQGMYDAMLSSIASRFPEYGKLIMISWPRYRGSFIMRQLEAGREDSSTFVSGPFATWDVNPERSEGEYSKLKKDNPELVAAKFEANPGAAIDRYFTNSLAILRAFHAAQTADFQIVPDENNPGRASPVDFDTMTVIPANMPEPDYTALYCIHVDLAVTGDRAGLAMSHHVGYNESDDETGDLVPVIQLDLVYWWQAQDGKEIEFAEIRRFILSLARSGYRIVKVTFDGYESVAMKQDLRKYDQFGNRVIFDYDKDSREIPRSTPIDADYFSLDRNTKGYDTLKEVIYEEGRLVAFFCPLAVEELLNLVLVNGKKVDHLDSGSKDVADAIAGSVHGAIEHQNEALRQSRYRSGDSPGFLLGGAQAQGPGRETENFMVSEGGRMLMGGAKRKDNERRRYY